MAFKIRNKKVDQIRADMSVEMVMLENDHKNHLNTISLDKLSKHKYIYQMIVPSFKKQNVEKLIDCYYKTLQEALDAGCKSIVFPLLPQDVSEWPRELWLEITVESFQNFLEKEEIEIILAVEEKSDFVLPKELTEGIENFIYENNSEIEYGDFYTKSFVLGRKIEPRGEPLLCKKIEEDELEEESFHEKLFAFIARSGMDNKDVWRQANLDRKLFSKIQCNENYHPKKKTVMALCIALKLNLEEAKDLLSRADWAFRPNSKFDLIVEKAISEKQYDITKLNLILFQYTNEVLGS